MRNLWLALCLLAAVPGRALAEPAEPATAEAPESGPAAEDPPAETPTNPEAEPAAPTKRKRHKTTRRERQRAQATPAQSAKPADPPEASAPEDTGVPGASDAAALATARLFLASMLTADGQALSDLATYPFHLEGRTLDSAQELTRTWIPKLLETRADLVSLEGLELLSPAEMEKRYGKPPPRLSRWPIKTGRTALAVANLSGHGAVLLLRQIGAAWKVAGYHD